MAFCENAAYDIPVAEKTAWQSIADDLEEKILSGAIAPGERIQTEEQIAAELNVSRHTVHRAMDLLHQKGLVVRQRRWGTVAAPKSEKSYRIAYLVDFPVSRFEAELMMQIEHALHEGERLVVSSSKNDPEREAENLDKLSREVDGIICYPADGDANASAFRQLADSGYPLVLVDRAPRGCEDLVVLNDNLSSSEFAVQRLIGQGHQRIAFFGGTNDQALSVRERYIGYRAAVDKLGYATRPYERWIPLSLDEYSESTMQAVDDALTAMLVGPEPPTAAFCVQDRLTIGLIEACNRRQLMIGKDFGIATYNDYGPMFLRQYWRMDRVLQNVELIAQTAVERLYSLMMGDIPSPGPIRIPAQYIGSQEFPQESVKQLTGQPATSTINP